MTMTEPTEGVEVEETVPPLPPQRLGSEVPAEPSLTGPTPRLRPWNLRRPAQSPQEGSETQPAPDGHPDPPEGRSGPVGGDRGPAGTSSPASTSRRESAPRREVPIRELHDAIGRLVDIAFVAAGALLTRAVDKARGRAHDRERSTPTKDERAHVAAGVAGIVGRHVEGDLAVADVVDAAVICAGVGTYVTRSMFDLDPFSAPENGPSERTKEGGSDGDEPRAA